MQPLDGVNGLVRAIRPVYTDGRAFRVGHCQPTMRLGRPVYPHTRSRDVVDLHDVAQIEGEN
eukprot:34440-Eustigmatos_ZCMA.PRE.1